MEITEVADRLEITDVLSRYARAVDTGDWDLWRSLFTEDAEIDYSAVDGPVGRRGEVSQWLAESMALLPMKQHYITNIECDVDGDTAQALAMFYNPMMLPGQTELTICGGWYRHQLVRTPEGWRTRAFREENVWFGSPVGDRRPAGPAGAGSSTRHTD